MKLSKFCDENLVIFDMKAGSKAEAIDGVVRVITAKDIPGENRYGKIILG